jgi:hypothetical protein
LIPVVNIGEENVDAGIEEFPHERGLDARNSEQNNPESVCRASLPPERSTTNSRRDRRSGSSSSPRPVPLTKAFVLPILMWPKGLVEDLDESPPDDAQLEDWAGAKSHYHSLKTNQRGPPRARQTESHIPKDQAGDSSLAEVLDRVYSSLLTDKSSNHHLIFREMDIAHRKDATFKLPEQKNPGSEIKEDVSRSKDGTQGGKSKYDPTEGFLHVGPTSDLSSERAQVPVPEYQMKLLQLSTTANNLLECFMPADYSNPVTWRYYGSIKRIIKVRIYFPSS